MSELDLDMLNAISDESLASEQAEFLSHTNSHAICSMQVEVRWQSDSASHTDCLFLPRVNLWRDVFPGEIEAKIMDQPSGYEMQMDYPPGELVSNWVGNRAFTLREREFNHQFRDRGYTESRVGRFYPRGIIGGSHGVYPDDFRPLRLTALDPVEVDLNHPLAQKALKLGLQIGEIWAGGSEHGGQCQDVMELLLNDGPGMQARWHDTATDFWSDTPFSRVAADADAAYYLLPRLLPHLDQVAYRQISDLYGSLLKAGSKVLDLMSGTDSHLPDALSVASITGLGLNKQELEANKLLAETVIQDINLDHKLPFEDGSFDAVICTDAVEYQVNPVELFADVSRVLKPGGVFVVQFSNRWDSAKAIKIWGDLHEFERLGLVTEYFIKSAGFGDLQTRSVRGLLRPLDDETAPRLLNSDPVYAVWGYKD